MTKLAAIAAALVLVALVGGTAIYTTFLARNDRAACGISSAVGADVGGPFDLVDAAGRRMTEDEVLERPAIVYFGYTFCPDICPIDTQIMVEAVDILEKYGIDVRPVFITVDPARDTPQELAYYAEAMHPKMLALTGSEEDIRAAADAYKVFYNKVEMGGSATEYLMEHTGFTYLMTPEHGLAAVFRRDFPPEQIAADIQKVLAAL